MKMWTDIAVTQGRRCYNPGGSWAQSPAGVNEYLYVSVLISDTFYIRLSMS